jgi:hypothetical protein
VRAHVQEKVAAIAAHRTQYPIDPDMFPADLLEEMFATEYFRRVLPRPEREQHLLPL